MHAPNFTRKAKCLSVSVLTLMLMTMLWVSAAWADTFTVTNTKDSGAGSLRAAIKGANYSAGADEILFADGVSGTITLASPLPNITDPAGLSIDGGGDVTVSGNNAVRVFAVGEGAALSLRNLTVSDGQAEQGGGQADQGGGIFNGGGTLTVIGSTISSNVSALSGAGIYNDGGTVEVANSTISDNRTDNDAGGIFNASGGTVEVINSTISNNTAPDIGGGIRNFGTLKVTNSTISGNDADFAGGGIAIDEGTVEVASSIISGNNSGVEGPNCWGEPADGGYNVSDDGTCGFTQATGSLPDTDPLLDPDGLQDNGGPTKTIALQPDSPAVDLVGEGACPPPATDQRGVQRPQGEACDSGAYELVQGPKTKAECKKGGYKEFGFKNQGQCIASLQRNAKTSQ
jgi:hypothetical protein